MKYPSRPPLSGTIIRSFYRAVSLTLPFCLSWVLCCFLVSCVSSNNTGAALPRSEIIASWNVRAITVCAGGCDFSSLQAAVDAFSPEYDCIVLMDPVLVESGIVIAGKTVEIRGFGPELSAISGGDSPDAAADRIFRVEETGALILRDLAVRNGQPRAGYRCGGGISNSGSLYMKNCIVSDNRAVYAAGIWNQGSIEAVDCVIARNRTVPPTTAEIMDATGCTGSGGGIKTEEGSRLVMRGCSFLDNSTMKKGGGIFFSCESRGELTDCEFRGNYSVESGGAIHLRGDLVMTSCVVEDNEAKRGTGGIFSLGRLWLSGSVIRNNVGGDFRNGSGGAGFYGHGTLELDTGNTIGVIE